MNNRWQGIGEGSNGVVVVDEEEGEGQDTNHLLFFCNNILYSWLLRVPRLLHYTHSIHCCHAPKNEQVFQL